MRFLAASSSNKHPVNNGILCTKNKGWYNAHYQPPGYKSYYNIFWYIRILYVSEYYFAAESTML